MNVFDVKLIIPLWHCLAFLAVILIIVGYLVLQLIKSKRHSNNNNQNELCIVIRNYIYKIIELVRTDKVPLWAIVAYVTFTIPVAILITIIPVFGSFWYNSCQILGAATCEFPPDYMWVIRTGLEWSFYLDIALLIFAYLSWKLDHYLPWLYRNFRNNERQSGKED